MKRATPFCQQADIAAREPRQPGRAGAHAETVDAAAGSERRQAVAWQGQVRGAQHASAQRVEAAEGDGALATKKA